VFVTKLNVLTGLSNVFPAVECLVSVSEKLDRMLCFVYCVMKIRSIKSGIAVSAFSHHV